MRGVDRGRGVSDFLLGGEVVSGWLWGCAGLVFREVC